MAGHLVRRITVRLAPVTRRVRVPGLPRAATGLLAGAAVAASIASGDLTVTRSLAAAAVAVATGSGDLSVTRTLAGAAVATSVAAGTLTASKPLVGAAQAMSVAAGTLTIARGLDGAAFASSSATGALSVRRDLFAEAVAGSTASGSLTVAQGLTGQAVAGSTGTGDLTVARGLSAAAQATAIGSGTLTVGRALDGAAFAGSTASATLTVARPLQGSATAPSTALGTLTVTKALASAAVAQSTAAGTLTAGGGATAFTDDFNRADELLNASANWTLVDGSASQMGVRSNQLAALGSVESTWLSPDRGSANHYVEGTLALVGTNGPFLLCRATNASNWVGARNSASQHQVFKRVAGTLTQIGSGNVTPAVGDRIRLEVAGDMVTLIINGAAQASATNVALGGDLAGVTRTGVIARTAARNPWVDDYKAGVL